MNAININTYAKETNIHTPVYDINFNTSGTNVIDLREHYNINPDEWKVYNNESELNLPEVDQKYWKTVNREIIEMTTSEKDAIDAAELTTAKAAKIIEIKQAANSHILAQYPDWKQRNYTGRGLELITIIAEGGTLTPEQTAERQAVEGMGAWIKSVRDQSDIMENDINSFTGLSAVQNYNIVFS